MLVLKILQKRLLSLAATKFGCISIMCAIVLILNSFAQFGTVFVQSLVASPVVLFVEPADVCFETHRSNSAWETIDLVYTWVNGSDPVHKVLLETWKNKLHPPTNATTTIPPTTTSRSTTTPVTTTSTSFSTSSFVNATSSFLNSSHEEVAKKKRGAKISADDSADASRFRDNDELRYSLRSVEKYAPWVRNIYIVTNDQIPDWLNLSHPRIHIIPHSKIFLNQSDLPTFSSPAIEAHIHRIPGLSDKFIYLNDDVMFGREVYPDDFYTVSHGQKVFLAWEAPRCHPDCTESWLGDGMCDLKCNVSSCLFDFGDCANGTTSRSRSSWSSSPSSSGWGNRGSGDACHPGCPDKYIGDKFCDPACKYAECGWDATDCKVDFWKPRGHVVELQHSGESFFIPRMQLSTHVQFQKFLNGSRVVEAHHNGDEIVRVSVYSARDDVLVLVFKPNIQTTTFTMSIKAMGSNGTSSFDFNVTAATGKQRMSTLVPCTFPPLTTRAIGNETEVTNETTPAETQPAECWETIEVEIEESTQPTTSTATTTPTTPTTTTTVETTVEITELPVELLDIGSEVPTEAIDHIEEVDRTQRPKLNVAQLVNEFSRQHELAAQEQNDEHEEEDVATGGSTQEEVGDAPAEDSLGEDAAENNRRLLGVRSAGGVEHWQSHANCWGRDEAVSVPALWRNGCPKSLLSDDDLILVPPVPIWASVTSDKPWWRVRLLDDLPLSLASHSRKLLDTYGDSLKHVNVLLTRDFGHAVRKVPAHMPHLIDKHIMARLQDRYPEDFARTSAAHFRTSDDMQYAFAYFWFLMNEKLEYNLNKTCRTVFDADGDGALSLNELRTVQAIIKRPIKNEDLSKTYERLRNHTEGHETPTCASLLKDTTLVDALRPIYSKKFRNRFEIRSLEEVAFLMIRTEDAGVQNALDGVRSNRDKFICLNDNMDSEDFETKIILHDFYVSMFPTPSEYELKNGEINENLRLDENFKLKEHRLAVESPDTPIPRILIVLIAAVGFVWMSVTICKSRSPHNKHNYSPLPV